jgi:hypothetical protein
MSLVYGGIGVGKTTLVSYFTYNIKKEIETHKFINLNNNFDYITHIYLNLFNEKKDFSQEILQEVILGFYIASHFFFGKDSETTYSTFIEIFNNRDIVYFKISNILSLINELYLQNNKKLLLTIQLDEFQELKRDLLNNLIRELAITITSKQIQYGICILPILSGTDTTLGIQSISNSKLAVVNILVKPLTIKQITYILRNYLNKTKFEYLLDNKNFQKIVASLGGIPRFSYFLNQCIEQTHELKDIKKFLTIVLNQLIQKIDLQYSIDKWNKILPDDKIRNLILWSINKKEILLDDQVNGHSIREIADTGILILNTVPNSNKFIIEMPLILLKVFNKTFQDIPDEYLNPVKETNENEFENIMDSLRIFRQNLMVKIGITKTTYKELYPFAIGYKEDLEKVIELKIMQRLKANGSSSSHNSIHKYNIKTIPVQNYISKTLDLSTLINENYNFLLSNVPKASFDSVIIHYNSNKKVELELIQYKSSENISRGMAPNDQSKGVLVLGSKKDDKTKKTIWSEFNKVNDSEHLKFYSQFPNHSKTLFIISNKPLRNFDKNSLPHGVCLISYENFQSYAGPFANYLYISQSENKNESIFQLEENENENENENGKEEKR